MGLVYGTYEKPPCVDELPNGDLHLWSGEPPVLIVGRNEIETTNAVLKANGLPKLEEWFAHKLPLTALIDLFNATSVMALFGETSSRGELGRVLAERARDQLLNLTRQNSCEVIPDLVHMLCDEYRANPERHERILRKADFRWDVVEIRLREQIAAYEAPQT